MKCPSCNYTYGIEVNFENKKTKHVGDEDFIVIKQMFVIEDGDGIKPVKLYVCPKCRVVMMRD